MFRTTILQMFAKLFQIPKSRRARRASESRLRRSKKRPAANLGMEPLEDRTVPAYSAANAYQLAADLAAALPGQTIQLTASFDVSSTINTPSNVEAGQAPVIIDGADDTITCPTGTAAAINCFENMEIVGTVFAAPEYAAGSVGLQTSGNANVTVQTDTFVEPTQGWNFTSAIQVGGAGTVSVEDTTIDGAQTGVAENGTGTVNLIGPVNIFGSTTGIEYGAGVEVNSGNLNVTGAVTFTELATAVNDYGGNVIVTASGADFPDINNDGIGITSQSTTNVLAVSGATFQKCGYAVISVGQAVLNADTFTDILGVAVQIDVGAGLTTSIDGSTFTQDQSTSVTLLPYGAQPGTVILSGDGFSDNSGLVINVQAGDVTLQNVNILNNTAYTSLVSYDPQAGLNSSLSLIDCQLIGNTLSSSGNGAALLAELTGGDCSLSVANTMVSYNAGATAMQLAGDNSVTASISTSDFVGNSFGVIANQVYVDADSNIFAANTNGDLEGVVTSTSAYNVVQKPIAVQGLGTNNLVNVDPQMSALQSAPAGSSYAFIQLPQNQVVLVGANPDLQGSSTLNNIVRTTGNNPCGPFAPVSNSGGGGYSSGIPITFPGWLKITQTTTSSSGLSSTSTEVIYISGRGVAFNLAHHSLQFTHHGRGTARLVQMNVIKTNTRSHPTGQNVVMAFYASCYVDYNGKLVLIQPGEAVAFNNVTTGQASRIVVGLPGITWTT